MRSEESIRVPRAWDDAIHTLIDCFWTIETADFDDEKYDSNYKIQKISQMLQKLDYFNKQMQDKYARYCIELLKADAEIQLQQEDNQ